MRTRLVGLLFLSASILAHAQGTQLWKQSSFASFEKGTPHGVAILSDGRLETSPVASEVLATPASYIWSMTADKHGNVYMGTGSPAMVLKIAPDGTSTRLLETKDISVQAVRMGPDGMLYAATLPNGNVYRIDPNGTDTKIDNAPVPIYKQSAGDAKQNTAATQPNQRGATVVFDSSKLNPKPTYIWDLAFDAQGRLYIATGGPATIYRVDLKNLTAPPVKFFSSSEQHIRCLLFAKDGTLYAGSDGRGLVYRISPDGKGFVLFEAPKQEIPAMALDPQGNLYVAALGDKSQSSLPPLSTQSGGGATVTATIRIIAPGSIASSKDSSLIPNGTEIYQIAPDGTPRKLWTSTHDVVYALAWQQVGDGQSGLLAGSGNQGHLYRIATDGNYADLAHLEAGQVTSFAAAGNTLYVATSNIGKLYKMSMEAAGKNGSSTYTSQVFDAKFFSQWGRAEVRGSSNYDLFARTGNIEQPAEGWSDWRKVTPGTSPQVALEKARFLQWKAELHPGASLSEVGFYYLPQNVAPVVQEVVVRLHTRVDAALNAAAQTAAVAINFPPSTTDGVSYVADQTSSSLMALRTRDWATVRWKAEDANGDHLSYSVYYRGDGEANWHLLKKHLRHAYTSFDLTRIPDGGYTLRIIASDAPSHPTGDARTGYRDSGHFLLATTPPALSPLRTTIENNSIHVAFEAQSKFATIARAYYSVDAGPWQYVEPIHRLSDSLQEQYDFTAAIPKPDADANIPAAVVPAAPAQHIVAVRVVDRAGNVATSKAVVE